MYSMRIASGEVIRDGDSTVVAPCQSVEDPDYQAYIAWVMAGNTPTVIEQPPAQVIVVTPVQIRLALNQMALRDALEAVLATNRDYRDWFEYSIAIHSNHFLVAEFAAALGKTDADIQALFELAASIEV